MNSSASKNDQAMLHSPYPLFYLCVAWDRFLLFGDVLCPVAPVSTTLLEEIKIVDASWTQRNRPGGYISYLRYLTISAGGV